MKVFHNTFYHYEILLIQRSYTVSLPETEILYIFLKLLIYFIVNRNNSSLLSTII